MNKKLKEQLWAAGYTVKKCMGYIDGKKEVLGYKILRGEKQVNLGEYASIPEIVALIGGDKNGV